MLTQIPIIGMLITTSMMLPTNIDAMTAQKISGWLVINSGPGCTLCTIMAASISAVAELNGMPSPSIGTISEVAAALLAVSGAATPSARR